jgi:hypothetical protein
MPGLGCHADGQRGEVGVIGRGARRPGDVRHIVGLVGKFLNATDELPAAAVASDTFKSVMTG